MADLPVDSIMRDHAHPLDQRPDGLGVLLGAVAAVVVAAVLVLAGRVVYDHWLAGPVTAVAANIVAASDHVAFAGRD